MAKKIEKQPQKLKKIYLIPLAILILLFLAYLGRGWIRRSLVPTVAGWVYANKLQSTLDKEYNSLQKPFDALGIPNVKKGRGCNLAHAKHFKITLSCGAEYSAYTDRVAPDLAANSARLSNQFKDQGWSFGNTDVGTLGKNISQGIDWTPDAAYIKFKGPIACLADFNTAFSKPKPPAINGSVSCNKAIDIF